MIGEFELPGDENVRNGKVGGQQNPNAAANAGGQQSNNTPMGLPQGGSAGQQDQQAKQGGGAQPPPGAQQQSGGAQGGAEGPQNPNAGGQQIAGAGDPGAQPQGVQVAELGGAPNGEQAAAGAAGGTEKPQQMAIGDKAMRIDPSQPNPGIVGSQQQVPAGHTQQHDKGTGSGGKGPAGGQGGGRIEKGKTMPAGL